MPRAKKTELNGGFAYVSGNASGSKIQKVMWTLQNLSLGAHTSDHLYDQTRDEVAVVYILRWLKIELDKFVQIEMVDNTMTSTNRTVQVEHGTPIDSEVKKFH